MWLETAPVFRRGVKSGLKSLVFGASGDSCAGQRVPSLTDQMKASDCDCADRAFVIKANVEAALQKW